MFGKRVPDREKKPPIYQYSKLQCTHTRDRRVVERPDDGPVPPLDHAPVQRGEEVRVQAQGEGEGAQHPVGQGQEGVAEAPEQGPDKTKKKTRTGFVQRPAE